MGSWKSTGKTKEINGTADERTRRAPGFVTHGGHAFTDAASCRSFADGAELGSVWLCLRPCRQEEEVERGA